LSDERVLIRQLPTGVRGLDEVLGGGFPEYSFNLLAGAPGTGKTTLAQQVMFANATRKRPALHFTVLGEPPIKMLRYQQQFGFFDLSRVGSEVILRNLTEDVLKLDLGAVLEAITKEVERTNPGIVVVDSFRTVMHARATTVAGDAELQQFVQLLALRLTSWEATTFLIGEYIEEDARNPVFTVADGIVWLANEVDRSSTVRKLRATKMRGQETLPGLHTFRISSDGLVVYPRSGTDGQRRQPRPQPAARRTTGVPGLDEMVGGGIPSGDSVLLVGPTGAGKTILATQFIAAGIASGEKAIIGVFEEHPQSYTERAKTLGLDVEGMVNSGMLEIMFLRMLDLSVEETLDALRTRVSAVGAGRVVIDSLSGFEVALAPAYRQDFREALYRMIGALTGLSITVLSTMEIAGTEPLQFTPYGISFLADDLIALRYIEMNGQLRRVLSVVKMRGSAHSHDIRAYDVTTNGVAIGETLGDYHGILTGIPMRRPQIMAPSAGATPA
jgi:circadian clock protein KaiC